MANEYKRRDPAVTSRIMAAVRPNRGRAEVAVRSELHRRGLRFRKNVFTVPGRPDIVFTKRKVAVFIDGDFWHARMVREQGMTAYANYMRTPNSPYWIDKARKRVQRDDEVSERLQSDGWSVLRFWESDVVQDIDAIADAIEQVERGS